MESINNQQAKLMHEVFAYLHENGKHHQGNHKQFNISTDELSFIRQQICIYGEPLGLLVSETFTDKDKHIVSFDKYKCDQFMANGGFEEYFEKKQKKEKVESKRQERKDKIDQITLLQKYWWIITLIAGVVGYFIAIQVVCKC